MHYLHTYGLTGLLLTALAGCTIEKNLLTEDDTGATAGDDATDGASDTGKASDTDEPTAADTGVDTLPDTTTGAEDTGEPGDCAAKTEAECDAEPACQAVHGAPEDFAGCPADPQFLGCIAAGPCDTVLLTVCEDDSDASYVLSNGCSPAGFTACEGLGVACGACVGLGEAECAAAGCTPISGAPHVGEGDELCADFNDTEFLGCLPPGTACPPQVLTLCATGTTEPAWEVGAGCFVDGFESCGDGTVSACTP